MILPLVLIGIGVTVVGVMSVRAIPTQRKRRIVMALGTHDDRRATAAHLKFSLERVQTALELIPFTKGTSGYERTMVLREALADLEVQLPDLVMLGRYRQHYWSKAVERSREVLVLLATEARPPGPIHVEAMDKAHEAVDVAITIATEVVVLERGTTVRRA